jgi:hypothetical protein
MIGQISPPPPPTPTVWSLIGLELVYKRRMILIILHPQCYIHLSVTHLKRRLTLIICLNFSLHIWLSLKTMAQQSNGKRPQGIQVISNNIKFFLCHSITTTGLRLE